MENFILIVDIILAVLLIGSILLQKSEGGALGLGVSQDNFMSSRSASSFLTKATTILATLFIITSISLTIMSRDELPTTSVLEKVEEKKTHLNLKFLNLSNNCLYLFFKIYYTSLPWRDMYLSLAAWFHH